MGITSAAANVPAHFLANSFAIERVSLIEQRNGRNDLARRTEAALEAVALDHGSLHWMKFAIRGNPFHSRNPISGVHHRKR